MIFRRRIAQIVLILCILAAGLYSFISLDYLSKVNPIKIIQAVQSFGQNNSIVLEGGHASASNQPPPSAGTNQALPIHSKGENSSFGSLWNLLSFLGVFVSTTTITHLIDQALRKPRRVAKA